MNKTLKFPIWIRAPREKVNGELFNVGSDANNYQLGSLAETVCEVLPKKIRIDWYGDADHRSYRVDFAKIEALGWKAKRTARDGALEIYEKLEAGAIDKTTETITLEWYQTLTKWHRIIKEVELHGGIVNINL